MGFILYIVALIILGIVSVLNTIFLPIYYIFTFNFKAGAKHLNTFFYKMALSIDQFGNVMCASLFNLVLIEKDGHKYGDEDDTISYITAKNMYKGKLKTTGVFLAAVLEWLDRGHMEKAIYNKQQRDREALERITENKYFD